MESQDYLLDWDVLKGADLDRYPYSVADVSVYPFKYENSDKCDIIPEVISAAYRNSINLAVSRCQQYYYIGTESQGSVVCQNCMRAARYTLFSVFKTAFINLMHVHFNSLPICFYCKCKIQSISIKKCVCNKNVEELVRSAPMYRVLRTEINGIHF